MVNKVLLINPKFTEEVTVFSIPISLLYLGSWLVYKGYEVNILDALHFKDMQSFNKRIESELPNALCVGISVMSSQIPHALEISKFVKKLNVSMTVIWGGVHPTLYPEQTAQSEFVDFVVNGEGEHTLCELLEAITQGNLQPTHIKGLAFQINKGKTVLTSGREPLDVNELPSVEWGLLDTLKIGSGIKEISKLTLYGLPLLTSRGCPHHCQFCINSILKTKYRYRSNELVLNDIKKLMDMGVERVHFEDEDFFANPKRIRELLDGIEENGFRFKWSASVRTDYFRKDYLGSEVLLSRVKRSGCYLVGTGAESGSQRILDMITKDITVEDTLNMAKCLNQSGLDAIFAFMIGLPHEEESDYKQTLKLIDEIIKINDSFSITGMQIYRPYPGSQLFFECLKYGLKQPSTIEEWADSPYIHLELSRNSYYDKKLYPWVEYAGDLTNLVFYAALMGIRPEWKPITKLLRFIGRTRCRRYYFKFPIEKKLYGLLRGTRIENFLRKKGDS